MDSPAASALQQPLSGMRILDLTSVLMGPYGTHILADLGADVIKIEPPQADAFRAGATAAPMTMNLYRNKRSIVLDLKAARDRAVFDALVPTADVLVHNLRPQVLGRLRLQYADVRALNPDIVFCSARGFSQHGRYGAKPAYDDMIQAASGFASLAVKPTGEPRYAPASIFDKIVGQAVAYAVLGALLYRERGGGGQEVEVPMFETAVEFNLVEGFGQAVFVPPRGESGYLRVQTPERRPSRTADGYACIMPYTGRNWFDFMDLVGRSEWKSDPRFAGAASRAANIALLYAMVHEEAAKRTTADWVEVCETLDIACMPVLGVLDLPQDPHIQDVQLISVVEHPTEGAYSSVRSPIGYSASPYRLRRHAPAIGENTAEILAELGMTLADREPRSAE
jgi:crotonobetainyl-CoA:carnitine CoA-transferase CaiB-like acyl-CoA transferase